MENNRTVMIPLSEYEELKKFMTNIVSDKIIEKCNYYSGAKWHNDIDSVLKEKDKEISELKELIIKIKEKKDSNYSWLVQCFVGETLWGFYKWRKFERKNIKTQKENKKFKNNLEGVISEKYGMWSNYDELKK